MPETILFSLSPAQEQTVHRNNSVVLSPYLFIETPLVSTNRNPVFGLSRWIYAYFCVCLSQISNFVVQKLFRMSPLPAKALQSLVAVFIHLFSLWLLERRLGTWHGRVRAGHRPSNLLLYFIQGTTRGPCPAFNRLNQPLHGAKAGLLWAVKRFLTLHFWGRW